MTMKFASMEELKVAVARHYSTPCLMIDLDVVESNIARAQALCDAAGVAARPHIKTHKNPQIAAMQQRAGRFQVVGVQGLDGRVQVGDRQVERDGGRGREHRGLVVAAGVRRLHRDPVGAR